MEVENMGEKINTPDEYICKEGVENNQTTKMARIIAHLSLITLNFNGLNSSVKRHRLVDWIKKKKNKKQSLLATITAPH
jgi:hypothetical protein